MNAGRKVLALLATAVLFAFLLYNFLELLDYPSKQSFSTPEDSKPFSGQVAVSLDSYNAAANSISVSLTLTVQAKKPDDELHKIALSSQESIWKYFHIGDPGVTHSKVSAGGSSVDSIKIVTSFLMPLEEERSSILYPFDSFTSDMVLQACANSSNACIDEDNTNITSTSINYSSLLKDPGFILSMSTLKSNTRHLVFKRNGFVRLASILLFIIAILFFIYLLFWVDSKELLKGALGYFGALWALRGLIVTKSVVMFPTVVDYVILTIYCVLFVAVLVRLYGKESKDGPPKDPDGRSGDGLHAIDRADAGKTDDGNETAGRPSEQEPGQEG